jgi:glycopeptide antibiotics resistance protein
MKTFFKTVLALYLLVLLWLVLFKFSADVVSVILYFQTRSLNLIPFAGNGLSEIRDNFLAFVPLGLLLGINYKPVGFGRKAAFVFLFSVAIEMLQFVFAIGATDITDVIMNTLGGVFGLGVYELGRKYIKSEKVIQFLDFGITGIIAVLLIAFLLLRIFVFQVRY